MSNEQTPSEPSRSSSGIEGWSFYPTDAEGLHDAIRGSGDFTSLSEVSRFASAAVRVMLAQAKRIEQLELRRSELQRKVGRLENPRQ